MTQYEVRLKDGRGLVQAMPVSADSDVEAVRIAIEWSTLFGPMLDSVLEITAPPECAPPSIGRIVHLTDNDGAVVPAIITAVHEGGGASLTVFQPDHLPGYVQGVTPFSHTPKRGHWNWPPRA